MKKEIWPSNYVSEMLEMNLTVQVCQFSLKQERLAFGRESPTD